MSNTQTQDELKKVVIAEKPNLNFTTKDGKQVRILSKEDEEYLEQSYNEMLQFMRDNHATGLSGAEQDDLYTKLQISWNEVSGKNGGRLNDVSFSLVLHRNEFKYLYDLLKNKIEYDVDTIFYGMELLEMLDDMKKSGDYENDDQGIAFKMNPIDIHYLYHIISKQTVKGLNTQAFNFSEVIKRIALSSNIFNHYKQNFDNIAKAIQLWVASLEEGVAIKEGDPIYQMIWGNSDVKPTFVNSSEDSVQEIETEG